MAQPVALRFKHFGEFIAEQSLNLSGGGMFIRTARPQPVASVFEFELRLADASPLLRGKAQVAWVRRRGENAERPAGMGVRFVELDDDSRAVILHLVGEHEANGGRAAGAAAAASQAAPEAAVAPDAGRLTAAPPRPPAGDPAAGPSAAPPAPAAAAQGEARAGSRRPWMLLSLALALALAASWWPRPARQAPATATPPAVLPASSPPTAAAAAAEPAPEPPQIRRVRDWASAWSEQRVDGYLTAYSARFEPPAGLGREAWERQRRARILAPQRIEVDLAFLELEELGAGRSRVSFVQVYESDSYRDVVRKALELEREEGGWKIVRESVEP